MAVDPRQELAELEELERLEQKAAGPLPEYEPKRIPKVGKPQISPWETAITSAAKGATFGYLPQIYGGLAALVPGGQGYTEARDSAANAIKESEKQNEGTALASELAGGMLLPGGAALNGSKGLGNLAMRGAAAGGLSGLITNPGESNGEVSPLQLGDRAVGGLVGAAFGGVLAPAGGYIGKKAADSRFAQQLREAPDLVQQKLRGHIETAEGLINDKVISPAERMIQTLIHGKKGKFNPEIIPGGTKNPVTGRDVLGKTKERLRGQATREVLEPGKTMDFDEGGRLSSAAENIENQGTLPLIPKETKPAFNNQNIPGTTTKNIFAPKAEVSEFPQWNMPESKQPTPTQQGMRMQELESRAVQDLTTDVPLEDLRRMQRVAGKQAGYADRVNASNEQKAAAPQWERARNVMRSIIGKEVPTVDPYFAQQSAGYKTIEGIENFKRSPISAFGRQEGTDPAAAFKAADRLLESRGTSGGLSELLDNINSAKDWNRSIEMNNIMAPLGWAGRFLTQKVPGTLGRLTGADTQIGNEAYRKLLMSLAAERARATVK